MFVRMPLLFSRIVIGPHSNEINRSGSPSLSMSLNTDPDTSPIFDKTIEFFLSGIYLPFSFIYNIDEAGMGYLAGITRPPAKISKSPSLSISACDNEPII